MSAADHPLIKYFSRFDTLSEQEKKAILDSMTVKRFPKNEILLKEGQRDTDTFFVVNGLVRRYKIVNGEEITTGFFSEQEWIISLSGVVSNTPSTSFLVCQEDTELVVGNELKARELFSCFPRLEALSRAVMEAVYAEQQELMSTFLTDSAEQRYLHIAKTRPQLLQRVPQYHIASYLGIKPESLSRIRKRLAFS